MIIGIAGPARVGKDTAATYLSTLTDMATYGFANPLKDAACHMFGISKTMAYGRKNYDREQIVPEWGISVRQMLQKLGTECARDVFGKDFWLIRANSELSFNNKYRKGVVISDVRYANEAQWIIDKGGIVICLLGRDTIANSGHISEGGIPPSLVSSYINNSGTKDRLYSQLQQVWNDYRLSKN